MSYRCDNCNAIRIGKQLSRVSEIRDVNYNRVFTRLNKRDKKVETVFDTTFKGTEYVYVEKLCEDCYEKFKDNPPIVSSIVKNVDFLGNRKRKKVEEEQDSSRLGELKDKFERE